jgi:3-deoxy-7-phosphoheptulonate synthase
MIESNLKEGKQTLKPGVTHPSQLKYGVSVTDACIDISTTDGVLNELALAVQKRRAHSK